MCEKRVERVCLCVCVYEKLQRSPRDAHWAARALRSQLQVAVEDVWQLVVVGTIKLGQGVEVAGPLHLLQNTHKGDIMRRFSYEWV